MESIGAIHVNRAFTLALLALTICVLFTNDNHRSPPSYASAAHFFPFAKFYLNFKNRLTGTGFRESVTVQLECKKLIYMDRGLVVRPLNTVWIAQNDDWGFSFRTSTEAIAYDCTFHCLGLNGFFDAFVDTPEFEDYYCGGRHCTWLFTNEGLFLFNLTDGKYYQKISFRRPPDGVNNGTSYGRSNVYSFRFGVRNNITGGDRYIQGK